MKVAVVHKTALFIVAFRPIYHVGTRFCVVSTLCTLFSISHEHFALFPHKTIDNTQSINDLSDQ